MQDAATAPPCLAHTSGRSSASHRPLASADNVNGHANPTGFPLKQSDLVAYNKFLAAEAHKLGLSIGLKNGLVSRLGGLLSELVGRADGRAGGLG